MDWRDLEHQRQAAYFLARLDRLCHLEDRFVSPPEAMADASRLVRKAIFATYCECLDLGLRAEADRILAPRRPPALTEPGVAGSEALAAPRARRATGRSLPPQ